MTSARRALIVSLFAVAFGTNVATPLFLIYEVDLSLSQWTVTALFAIYPIGLAPALVFAGPVSDAYGRRPVMFTGLLLSGAASAVMMFGAHSIALLFLGRFLLGAVSGLAFVTGSAWMQELGGDPMWNARLNGTVMYAGFGLGPFVGGILGQWGPAPLVVPYALHLGLVIAGIATFGAIPETIVPQSPRPPIRPNLGIPDGQERPFWTELVPIGIGVFCFPSLTFGLFPVLLRPQMATIAVAATGVIFLISMGLILPAQAWVGRVGLYRAAPTGLALGAVGTALGLIAFTSGWWPLLLPGALAMGSCSGISLTSGLRLVDTMASPRRRGALTGAFYAVAYTGMLSPLVISTAARSIGYVPMLAAYTIAAAALALTLRRTVRKVVPRPDASPVPPIG